MRERIKGKLIKIAETTYRELYFKMKKILKRGMVRGYNLGARTTDEWVNVV